MERLCVDDRGLRLLGESRDRIGFWAEIPSCPRRLVKSARIIFERIGTLRSLGSLKSLKTLRLADSGRQKAVIAGELPVLSNIINGFKVIRVVKAIKDFLVGGRYEFSRLSEVAVWGRCKIRYRFTRNSLKTPEKSQRGCPKILFQTYPNINRTDDDIGGIAYFAG